MKVHLQSFNTMLIFKKVTHPFLSPAVQFFCFMNNKKFSLSGTSGIFFFIYLQVRMMARSSPDSSALFLNYSDYGPCWQTVREQSVSFAVFGAVLSFVLPSPSIARNILLITIILRLPQLH